MTLRLDIAPAPETVRDYAEDAVRNMQAMYGVRLDYSVASLAHVDRVLAEWRDGGAPVEAINKSLYAFGSYAGEVLREQEPGRWVEPPRADHGNLDTLFLFVRLFDGREWPAIARTVDSFVDPEAPGLHASLTTLLAL
ncbi:hypothetical protein [Lysobacter claricitrinus]|uniref:hypothetical protein n=1 Tax=Lysobacter claricitrinus TaxID=3367728 RepID=UPI0037DB382A